MRDQLKQVCDTGESLNDWKRAFILSPALKPCRANVIQYDYARGRFADSWFEPKFILNAVSVMDANREVSRSFLETLDMKTNDGNPKRKKAQIHEVATGVDLTKIVEELLVPYRCTSPEDSQEMIGLLLQLSDALEQNPQETATVYRMSPQFQRDRTVYENGKITELFQGADPVSPPEKRGSVYPGDGKLHEAEDVTVQLHFIDLKQDKIIIAKQVAVIAIWVPRRMAKSWIIQEQQ